MSDTNTARESLRVPLALAWSMHGRPIAELDELLDEYDAARRNEVLIEGTKLITASSLAWLDGIDELDRRPSDWERHEQWLAAAGVLRKATRVGRPKHGQPAVLCRAPHPIAPDVQCALSIAHDAWHEDETGDRWPSTQFPLATRTTTAQED